MSLSISRKQSINESFLAKVKEYKLEGCYHTFLSFDTVSGFNTLFNKQTHKYPEFSHSKELIQELNKYKVFQNTMIRKTETKIETFKDRKIWSNEDKFYKHILLYPENEIIIFPKSKNKAYFWCFYTASVRGGNDTVWYVLSFQKENLQEAESFINLLDKFEAGFNVSEKYIHVTGGSNIKITGKYTWDDLVLPDHIIKAIKDDLEFWMRAEDLYRKNNLIFKRSYLLCGPPGNGKTATARVILSTYEFSSYMFNFTNKRLDDNDLIETFQQAKHEAPSLILLEDLDKSFDRSSFCNVSLECLLNCLDGISTNEGIVVLATANQPELLDRSIRHRPGRFDIVINFENPKYDQREKYFNKLLGKDAQVSYEVLKQIANETDGMSMAFLKLIYETAGSRAFKRASNGSLLIKDEDLLESLEMCLNYYETSKTGRERKVGFESKKEDPKTKTQRLLRNKGPKYEEIEKETRKKRIALPFKDSGRVSPFEPAKREEIQEDENCATPAGPPIGPDDTED